MKSLKSRLITLIFMCLIALSVSAKEVAGVTFADTTEVGGETLKLNGVGVRSKFFFKIYLGALYLPKKANSSDEVYKMKGSKQILMHFIYDEVPAEKLVAAWNEGFEGNNSENELMMLSERIQRFNSHFKTIKAGETIQLDMIPGQGTTLYFNGEKQARFDGDDFIMALLKIWLGKKPADEDLKEGMLDK